MTKFTPIFIKILTHLFGMETNCHDDTVKLSFLVFGLNIPVVYKQQNTNREGAVTKQLFKLVR